MSIPRAVPRASNPPHRAAVTAHRPVRRVYAVARDDTPPRIPLRGAAAAHELSVRVLTAPAWCGGIWRFTASSGGFSPQRGCGYKRPASEKTFRSAPTARTPPPYGHARPPR